MLHWANYLGGALARAWRYSNVEKFLTSPTSSTSKEVSDDPTTENVLGHTLYGEFWLLQGRWRISGPLITRTNRYSFSSAVEGEATCWGRTHQSPWCRICGEATTTFAVEEYSRAIGWRKVASLFPFGDQGLQWTLVVCQRAEVKEEVGFEATPILGVFRFERREAQETHYRSGPQRTSLEIEPALVADMSPRLCAGYRF